MGVVTQLDAPETAVDRRRLGLEIVIVLGLSLGQSAVYAVLRIIERLTEQGYVSLAGQPGRQGLGGPGGRMDGSTRFEVTDKALDFLGYRALRDLLGSLGRSSVGRHDTRELATGVEAGGPPRPYAFGDTLNLDAASTVLNAVTRAARDRGAAPHGTRSIAIEEQDLTFYRHIAAPAYGEAAHIIMEQDSFLYELTQEINPANEIAAVQFFDLPSYHKEPAQVPGVLLLFKHLEEDGLITDKQ